MESKVNWSTNCKNRWNSHQREDTENGFRGTGAHLQADASVEWYLDGVRVVSGLHQCRKVTDSDLLERRLAPAGRHADARQALPQRARAPQQDIVFDLRERFTKGIEKKSSAGNRQWTQEKLPVASCCVLWFGRRPWGCRVGRENSFLLGSSLTGLEAVHTLEVHLASCSDWTLNRAAMQTSLDRCSCSNNMKYLIFVWSCAVRMSFVQRMEMVEPNNFWCQFGIGMERIGGEWGAGGWIKRLRLVNATESKFQREFYSHNIAFF